MRSAHAAALFALLALPALADDKADEAAKKTAALRDRVWKEHLDFSAQGTREEALKKFADESGIAVTIPEDVRKAGAEALAAPVSMVFRDASLRELLDAILKDSRLFARFTPDGLTLAVIPAPAPADCKPGPGADVILVATFVESDNINFSGRVGRTFWLRIEKVARLRRGDPKADNMEFTELFKRSADLDDTGLLQATLIGRDGDKALLKEMDRLSTLLQAGKKFLVSAKSIDAVDTLGTVREHKWGEVNLEKAKVVEYSDDALKALEEGK